ncbi:MAG: alkaline shock response membrane anchor protein AmaP [Anaerovibrio sp.]|uniref:alkaline shock response membrane anchor protein AmaP n=1 Tax=Anaerovibrio sp. TaxID=1872532 RepID=UPI0025CF27A5|nr:alkaline shock response membrane anchor protein AmaP [Anaerovibrio sp.]MCR5175850.1 alkaline shock response membrane anchor protein AmaP [Anaerovibrio sp.]
MGIINRVLLFFYSLFFGIFCLGVVLLVFNIVPERVLLNEYQYAVAQWQTGAVAGVVFLISIHLFFCSFSGKGNKDTSSGDIILVHGNAGEVNVSLNAVKMMIERISTGVRGVRDVKVKSVLRHDKEKGDYLMLDIKINVGQERSIAAISDDIRTQAGKYLSEIACINNYEVAVSVAEIVSGVVVKKKRLK